MDDWSNCPGCNFYRETLLELPCCQSLYCVKCLQDKARCPKCTKYFDIAKCAETRSLGSLVSLVDEVLVKCRFSGCTHKTTKILINQHEASCSHAFYDRTLAEALMDPSLTPLAVATQRKKNIFSPFMMYNNVKHILDCMEKNVPLDSTPIPEDSADDEFFTHIILDTDTLQGLAIKYKVSVFDLKETNRMTTDQLHERTALRIPRRTQPTFTEADAKGLEKLLVQRLVQRFRRKTSIKSNEEALFYLENANMDVEAAYKAWIDDTEWEKTAPPFVSCINSCAEELELFEKETKRRCCSLVF